MQGWPLPALNPQPGQGRPAISHSLLAWLAGSRNGPSFPRPTTQPTPDQEAS